MHLIALYYYETHFSTLLPSHSLLFPLRYPFLTFPSPLPTLSLPFPGTLSSVSPAVGRYETDGLDAGYLGSLPHYLRPLRAEARVKGPFEYIWMLRSQRRERRVVRRSLGAWGRWKGGGVEWVSGVDEKRQVNRKVRGGVGGAVRMKGRVRKWWWREEVRMRCMRKGRLQEGEEMKAEGGPGTERERWGMEGGGQM